MSKVSTALSVASVILPTVIRKAEPQIRAKLKEVIPLEGEVEDQIIDALEKIVGAKLEEVINVDIDGDGNVGTITFKEDVEDTI